MFTIKQNENGWREGVVFKEGVENRIGYLYENIKGVYMFLFLEDGLKFLRKTYLKSKTYNEAETELLGILNDPKRI